jgi:hypothetical protein
MRIDLKTIRETAGLSAAEQGSRMGLATYRTVYEIERRSDWLLSSLATYISAAGGHAELVVRVNDQELRFSVA